MEVVARALFPTVIWSTRFDDYQDLNHRLLESVQRLREHDADGVHNTNVNGWQSRNTLQTHNEFAEINGRIVNVCREIGASAGFAREAELRYQAWANVNPPGAFNNPHIHPNCHLSGVYYIAATPDSGSIYFRDPRAMSLMAPPPLAQATEITATESAMKPEPGRLYVFPAWLEHGVQPNRSGQDRVGISFNVQVVALPGSGR